AVAVMVTSPGATPAATPVALTVATLVSVEDQVKVTPAMLWPAASAAAAAKVWAAPWTTLALAGATMTLATSGGGGASGGGFVVPSLSLQAPKVLPIGPTQVPSAWRCSEVTGDADSVPASATPMSTEVMPSAGPLVAAKVPSYDRNSTTWPVLS